VKGVVLVNVKGVYFPVKCLMGAKKIIKGTVVIRVNKGGGNKIKS